MKLVIPCLACVLLLWGCAPPDDIPPSQEEVVRGPAVEEPPLMSLPDFYSIRDGHTFRSDPYIRAAVRLQGMGPKAAIKALEGLALQERPTTGQRVTVLCRMLFTKRAGGEFRRPMLGAFGFLGGTDYADWPLEPVEVVDGVPFLVVRGWAVGGGTVELSEEYLAYCLAECNWGGFRYAPKSAAEKAKALDKLTRSAKWKRPLEEDDRDFLAEQIK